MESYVAGPLRGSVDTRDINVRVIDANTVAKIGTRSGSLVPTFN